MAKFFVNIEDVFENEIHIKGKDVNHIKNVLRLPIGKEILINDRQGKDYKCIIKLMNADLVSADIVERLEDTTEPIVETCLFQSLIKGEKMEFVIQKAIEIGVTMIVPIITERCIVKIESEKKLNNKCERWQKIAESAAKQSKRGIIPEVMTPMSFNEALTFAKERLEIACIPFENEKAHHIKNYLRNCSAQSIGVFIGPEGGFTDEEITLASNSGVSSITLGRRILRSETAGIVTLANIMYEMGEI